MSSPLLKAPKGKMRVLGIDPSDTDQLYCIFVGDCGTPEEAFKVADDRNKVRLKGDNVCYFVYDDQGKQIHGHWNVGQASSYGQDYPNSDLGEY